MPPFINPLATTVLWGRHHYAILLTDEDTEAQAEYISHPNSGLHLHMAAGSPLFPLCCAVSSSSRGLTQWQKCSQKGRMLFIDKSHANCPLCMFLPQALFPHLPRLISSPNHSAFLLLPLILLLSSLSHSFFNVLNFYSKELTSLVHPLLSLRYNWQHLKLKYRMW